ncbi:virulence-related protein Nf314 [Naegleria gruberi]|uniref:Carboxypeptidase n=1 Tax=Naegleria gruberi TaxID=5762 RepID=D2VSG4_NAEGR|nr:virulence-related protein Nf314 [Naegleria gruberi]EFC40187.1 virulence-related protein Nf314 [Naegleria gruberi]|eukprot:XP_002672931.1 virulence-related protein Nf314 [Naegleria gruberi strain NEG-M]
MFLHAQVVMGQTSRDHLVTSLPGYNQPITFKSYTGYLNGNSTQHHLFYWFMECQENPATAPVVLWTNGGPGCSSIDGMVSEHGPFVVLADGKTVVSNPFAWNKRVNIIYLEQPIGVGYSYSDNTADYMSITDITAANDMNGAMRDFFSRFPQYVKNPFFISGESYGGVYVPSAAYRILQGNQQGELPKINLQGILVGNGVTDGEEDANSVPLFYKEHSLITIEDYNAGFVSCKGNFYANQNSADCSAFLSKVYASLTHLNPYYIYDSCTWLGDNGLNMPKRSINSKNHPLFQLHTHRATSRRSSFSIVGDESDSPCVPDHSVISYFNTPAVRSAIGATHIGNPNGWQVCSTFINYTTIYTTMLPFYTKLLPQIRILVYSGDVDTVLNTLGTQADEVIILTIQKQLDEEQASSSIRKGRRQLDYTLCEVHDDVPYTFHCHPIEIDRKTKLPINMANLISSEDMIGVVQDHIDNVGYLSNCQGKLLFDILLCPVGIFVYSATNAIIEKWIEMEEAMPYNQKNRKLMKLLDPLSDCSNNENFEKQLKHLIHTTLNEDNPFWATEENALMNEGFNAYIGSWYYLNNNQGVFATEIIPKFRYLGYQFWWKDEVDNLTLKNSNRKSNKVQDVSDDEEVQASLAEGMKLPKQLEWFKSEEFLSIDYKSHSLVKDYVQDMKNLGFYVEFFNWNSSVLEFNYP